MNGIDVPSNQTTFTVASRVFTGADIGVCASPWPKTHRWTKGLIANVQVRTASQDGIYAANVDALTIETVTLEKCGSNADEHKHAAYYVNNNTFALTRNSIIYAGGMSGIEHRCSGLIEDSVILGVPIGVACGGGPVDDGQAKIGGADITIRRCVIIAVPDVDGGRGWAMSVANARVIAEDSLIVGMIADQTRPGHIPSTLTLRNCAHASTTSSEPVIQAGFTVARDGGYFVTRYDASRWLRPTRRMLSMGGARLSEMIRGAV